MSLLKNKVFVVFITLAILASGLAFAQTASAITLGELVELFIALGVIAPDKIDAARSIIEKESQPTSSCLSLSYNHYLGRNDSETGGEVSKLQRYLQKMGDYTYGEITGYFGPVTQSAVQRWQARSNVVSSGSPETTGYGVVGPRTRSAMNCGTTVAPPVPPIASCSDINLPAAPSFCTAGSSAVYDSRGCQTGWKCLETTRTCPIISPPPCQNGSLVSLGTDANGCNTGFSCVPITPVINSFSASPMLGKAPLTISFSGIVNSEGYSIDYGDGTKSGDIGCVHGGCPIGQGKTNVSATHTYNSGGTYTAKLRTHFASNQGNCAGIDCNVVGTATITVTGGTVGGDNFSAYPTSGNAPLSVTATIHTPVNTGGGYNVCGPIVVGNLSWGDGTIVRPTVLGCSSQSSVSVSHTYQKNGNYDVTFTSVGGKIFESRIFVTTLTDSDTFSASPTSGNAPLDVTFSGSPGLNLIEAAVWIDFGDGTISDGISPWANSRFSETHTYTKAGTYTAKLLWRVGLATSDSNFPTNTIDTITIVVGSGDMNPEYEQVCGRIPSNHSCYFTDPPPSSCIYDNGSYNKTYFSMSELQKDNATLLYEGVCKN
jgi:PKD repeat protein